MFGLWNKTRRNSRKSSRKSPSESATFTKSYTKKQFLFNPNNPKSSFDVYIDKNPYNTIPIHYKTIVDVKNTIKTLEKLYKAKKYTHKRIWAVAMIMKVRLEVLKQKKPDEYKLAKRYFKFLGERTKMNEDNRYRSVFRFTGI